MSDFLHFVFPGLPISKEKQLAREIIAELKGGEGSGNFGHAGRPGEVGGSAGEDGESNNGKPELSIDSNGLPTIQSAIDVGTYNAIHDNRKVDGKNTIVQIIKGDGNPEDIYKIGNKNDKYFVYGQGTHLGMPINNYVYSVHKSEKLAEKSRNEIINQHWGHFANQLNQYVPDNVYWQDKEKVSIGIAKSIVGVNY